MTEGNPEGKPQGIIKLNAYRVILSKARNLSFSDGIATSLALLAMTF
ncbi:MAG: hypothetical protein ACUVUQ_10070 [Thermodesulfovibrionales bacterium]